jgi:uncharacterized protein (TIGR00730 family)
MKTNVIRRLCVFCGSSPGSRPEYVDAARAMGEFLAQQGITLVYGGGRVGLMGAIANATLQAGGDVIGVIPDALVAKEVAHQGLSDLRVVSTMHERKALMAELADGFGALPGGCGTFEEFFEVLTWAQLGIHEKPCGLLNVQGYYDPLLALLETGVSSRFIRDEHREMVLVAQSPEELHAKMLAYHPPVVEKWIDLSES